MKLLRNVLRVNGPYSLVTGALIALLAESLADRTELGAPILYVVGVGVFLFGVTIVWATRNEKVNLGFALTVFAADAVWVLGAIFVLAIPGSMTDKWLLALVSIPVAMFALVQAKGIVRSTEEEPLVIAHQVDVDAPAAAVWDQLVDFSDYHTWNPFITEAAGRAEQGTTLDLKIGPMRFKPDVTQVSDGETLEWLGHLGPSGVFDGRHRFDLERTSGGTRLIQSEELSGLLVPLLKSKVNGETLDGFKAMNQALLQRAESGAGHAG